MQSQRSYSDRWGTQTFRKIAKYALVRESTMTAEMSEETVDIVVGRPTSQRQQFLRADGADGIRRCLDAATASLTREQATAHKLKPCRSRPLTSTSPTRKKPRRCAALHQPAC